MSFCLLRDCTIVLGFDKSSRLLALAQVSSCRLDNTIDDTFTLLYLDKLFEVPGELILGQVERVLHIACVDKPILQHLRENPRVVNYRVTTNEQVIVCTITKVNALLILSVNHQRIVNFIDVNLSIFFIASFYNQLFAILHQEHVDNLTAISIKVNVIPLIKQVVYGK